MEWMRGRLAAALLGAGLLLWSGSAAWAHAVLRETVPADSSRLDTPPPEVRLRFNEPVTPVSVQVLDSAGRPVTSPGTATVQAETVRLALPSSLPNGTYAINFRVTSADGHPAAGTIVFGIGVTPTADGQDAPVEAPAYAALAALVVRALHYAALLAGVGGGLFLTLVSGSWSALSERLKPGLCLLLLASAITAVLLVGLNGVVLAGGPLSDLISAPVWSTGAASTTGLSAGVALIALLVSATGLALGARHAAGPALLVLGALLGAASLTTTGHAATAPPRWLSAPLVGLHGLMAAYWLGSLWPLAVALRSEPLAEAARLTRRFSRLAVGAVALLVAAGAVLTVLQVGTPQAVLTTDYGQNWLRKMLVVAGLLALAARNRLRLTPALVDGGTADALRRSIWTEMVFAAGVLLLTSAFALTPPPRALAAHDAVIGSDAVPEAGYTAAITRSERSALVEVVPAQPGRNRVRVQLSLPDGRPLDAAGAMLEWELPGAGIAPQRRPLAAAGPGVVGADDIEMPLAGRWSLRLSVPLDGAENAVFQTEVPIGAEGNSKESKP